MATKTGATPHGVNVVETEEASEEGEEQREEPDESFSAAMKRGLEALLW